MKKSDKRLWVFGIILVVACIWIWYCCFLWRAEITTVYVVRHAEKANDSGDTPLSEQGRVRAEELAHVLGDEPIDAVFVTEFLRTQQTGTPVAVAAGLTPTQYQSGDSQALVDIILSDHQGGRVLVVGHSTTVDDIAASLGATGLSDLAENQFDRLFVVHRFGRVAHLDRLRYGTETP